MRFGVGLVSENPDVPFPVRLAPGPVRVYIVKGHDHNVRVRAVAGVGYCVRILRRISGYARRSSAKIEIFRTDSLSVGAAVSSLATL